MAQNKVPSLAEQQRVIDAEAAAAVAPPPAGYKVAAEGEFRDFQGKPIPAGTRMPLRGGARAPAVDSAPPPAPAVDSAPPPANYKVAGEGEFRDFQGKPIPAGTRVPVREGARVPRVQKDSQSAQAERDSPYVDHGRPESSNEMVINIGEGYRELLGKETISVPSDLEKRDGQWVDTVSVISLTEIVDKALRKKKHEEIVAKGGYDAMTSEEMREIDADIKKESVSIAVNIQAASSAGRPITNPKKIISDKEDTQTIAEGKIPERDGAVAGLAYDAFTAAQGAYSGATKALGIKDDIKEGKGAAGFVAGVATDLIGMETKDFLDDDGNIVIPSKVGAVRPRQIVAYAYPSAGLSTDADGNVLSKLIQDVTSAPLATADVQQKIFEKKDSELRRTGEEGGLTEWLEAMDEAVSSPETIAEIRSNKPSWDYLTEADTTMLTVLPYVAIRSLTGVNMYTALERETGGLVQPRDYDHTGAIVQRARPRGTVKAYYGAYKGAEALLEGGTLGEAKAAREEAGLSVPALFGMYTGQSYMSGDEFSKNFLGPMTAAMVSPDGFMLALKGLGVGVKAIRAGKGLMYSRHATKQADAVALFKKDFDAAMASGKEVDISLLRGWDDISPAVKIQVREAMRGIVGKGDEAKVFQVQQEIAKRNAAAAKKQAEVAKILEDSGSKRVKGVNPKGGDKYRPAHESIHYSTETAATRLAVAKAEAAALQHRAVSTGLVEGLLEGHIAQLEKFGVMGKGAYRAAPGEFKAARAAFNEAISGLEKVTAGTASVASVNKALGKVNSTFIRLAAHGSDKANVAVKAMFLESKKASNQVRRNLDTLIRSADKDATLSLSMDAGTAIKRNDDAVIRVLNAASGPGMMKGAGMQARVSSFLGDAEVSLRKAADTIRGGRLLAPEGAPSAMNYKAFEALNPEGKIAMLKNMGGKDVWEAIQAVPLTRAGGKSYETVGQRLSQRGADLTPIEASRVLNVASQQAKNVPFSAWGMQSYLSAAQGVDLLGGGALGTATAMGARMEGYVAGLKTSGMRHIFKMVANKDVYNAGRLGEEMSQMGRKEVFSLVSEMRKAGRSDDAIFRSLGQWMDAPPTNQLGTFGQAGSEAPLAEGLRFLRNLEESARKDTSAFRTISHSFLGSGRKSGEQAKILNAMLNEIIEESATSNITYSQFVQRMRASLRGGAAGETMKLHEHLSAGVINASAGARMVEDLARIQAGFDMGTLKQAVKLSKNQGSDAFNRAAEVRALFQQMGISPENFRSTAKRSQKGGGASWDLVLSADNQSGLKAVVPRPLMDFLGNDISWMTKAEDAGKTWLLSPDLKHVAPSITSLVMLGRKGMTSGIILPRTAYFINNLHGGITQAITTAGGPAAFAATISSKRAFSIWKKATQETADEFLKRGGISFLDSGVPAMDARLAQVARDGAILGQKSASSIPAPQMGSINPMIRGIMDDAIIPPNHTFRTAAGEVLEKRQIIREMMKEGVFETRAGKFLIPPVLGIDGARPSTSILGDNFHKFVDGDWANVWSKAMDTIETEQRIGMYMHQRMTNGVAAKDAGRVVREAYFDWKYPPRLACIEVLSQVPVMMFASMWRNAVAHTASTLASGAKSRRLIQMYKAQEIAADSASTGDEDNPDPWFGAKGTQSYITQDATEEEAAIGKAMLGAETGSTAIATPEFISLGLVAIAINTAIMTAGVVGTGFDEPVTHNNRGRFIDYMRATSSQFIDPFLTIALQAFMGSGGDPKYGGDYDGPVRMNENETTTMAYINSPDSALMALDGLPAYLGVEEKEVKATGGFKTVADQRKLRLARLSPGWRRTVNIMGPLVRHQWGADSGDSFMEAFSVGGPVWEIVASEMGKTKMHVPTKEESRRLTQKRNADAAKRATE